MILRSIGEMFSTMHAWLLRRTIQLVVIVGFLMFIGMVTGVIEPGPDTSSDTGSVLHQLLEESKE